MEQAVVFIQEVGFPIAAAIGSSINCTLLAPAAKALSWIVL